MTVLQALLPCDDGTGVVPTGRCSGHVHHAFNALQERLGVELVSLIEDPQGATVRRVAADAAAQLAAARSNRAPAVVHVAAYASVPGTAPVDGAVEQQQVVAAAQASQWIAPAPTSVKMRIFCLPYAGGVSENVYAR